MIRNSSKILLLIVIIITASSPSAIATDSLMRCAAPSKLDLEEILGKPVKCPPDSGESVCFGKDGTLIMVQFNSSDSAESILISTGCVGIWRLTEIADKIVPKSNRGKFLRRAEKSRRGDCDEIYVEEYECLTVEYYEKMCQNCVPASIKIVWVK